MPARRLIARSQPAERAYRGLAGDWLHGTSRLIERVEGLAVGQHKLGCAGQIANTDFATVAANEHAPVAVSIGIGKNVAQADFQGHASGSA